MTAQEIYNIIIAALPIIAGIIAVLAKRQAATAKDLSASALIKVNRHVANTGTIASADNPANLPAPDMETEGNTP